MIKISDGSTIVQINANAYAAGANAAAAAEASAAQTATDLAGLHIYDSIADMQAATDFSPGDQITVRSYYGDGGNGGGNLVYDSTSTETADDGRVFTPSAPLPGRFNRKKGSMFLASEHGIIDHATTDQHAKLQSWIVACIGEGWEGRLDVLNANADGGSLWFNVDGNEASYASGAKIAFSGHIARHSRILNAAVTIGKFYNDEGYDAPVYTIDRGPTARGTFRDLHFDGLLRIVNVEGGGLMDNCSVFAETANTSFYDAPPTDWGVNIAGRNDGDDNALATTLYSDVTHLVEIINPNHFQFINNNVQKGRDVTNIAGDELGAIRISGSGNLNIDGGRMVDCRESFLLEQHSLYGGSNNKKIRIIGVHPENITESFCNIQHAQSLQIHSFGRPDTSWAGTTPYIQIGNSQSLLQNIEIDTHSIGIQDDSDDGTGTFLEVDYVDGLTVKGVVVDFEKGVVINGGKNIREITTKFENVADEINIAPDVPPYSRPDSPSTHSEVSTVRHLHKFGGSFVGHNLDPQWREFKGINAATTDVTQSITKDGLEVALGGGTPSDMSNGYKIATAPCFKPADGPMSCEAAYVASNSTMVIFTGMSDSPGDDLLPAGIGSGDVITPSAGNDDFAGFLYDRNATTDVIYCVTRRNGGTAAAVATTLVTDINDPTNLRVDIDADGNAKFYASGALLTTVSNAVSVSADLAFVAGCYTESGSAQTVTFRRATVEQLLEGIDP